MGFKVLEKLKQEERDRLNINNITNKEWENHYAKLWNSEPADMTENSHDILEEPTEMITIAELDQVLQKAKNRKSPGLDNINVELFKYGGQKLRETLLHLFNNIWKQRTTPSDWEEGLIINIYKKGSRNVCNNNRGITLLSTASKLFANILKNKVNK
jgi:hypothetical protein